MFVLDAPYASRVLIDWLERNNHPVLENAFSRTLLGEGARLNLVNEQEAVARIDDGERLCTNSENALDWVCANVHNESMVNGIRMCKDKELMRSTLSELDPNMFFKGLDYADLRDVSYADLPKNVVVKPTVGFCSLGVHAVQCQQDWDRAMESIRDDMERWNDLYPASVIEPSRFLIEEMVDGQEYALDMFYDSEGTPQIFNVLRHDFASPHDTSDRLYWCSGALMEEIGVILQPWLKRAGELMSLRDFCVHIELRIDGNDVHVIEFNPLRFAGLGGTDISLYARGMLAYDAYLGGEAALPFQSDDRYVMSVLMPDAATPVDATFDYNAFTAHFSHVLEMREFERAKMSAFGMIFMQARPDKQGDDEMDYLLRVNLDEFVL